MKMPFLLTLSMLLGVACAQGREPEAGLAALHQACLDAATDAVVLNVAAHPDDEASRTNTILRKKHGARVVTVYATYGDGGQNAIGREIGEELAYLRVRETLRAAAISDVEVRWLGFPDFGFSKTLDETLQVWGRDQLRDRLRAVFDEVDPDLIITNHGLQRGHGHHRACHWAILEVLRERTAKGARVPPLFARCGPEDAWVTVDPGELDPVRGETYARLAHRAWVQHETQGPWGPHDPVRVGKEWWQLVYPEGVAKQAAVTWDRWLPQRQEQDFAADSRFLPAAQLAEQVAQRLRVLAERDAATPRERRHVQALQRVLLALANVRAEVWLEQEEVPAGGEGRVFVVVHGVERVADLVVRCDGRAAEPVQAPVRRTPPDAGPPELVGENGAGPKPAPLAGRFQATFAPAVGEDDRPAPGPEPAAMAVEIAFTLDGVPIRLTPRLTYTTVPPVHVRLDRDVLMVPKGAPVERTFSASVHTHRSEEPAGSVMLGLSPGIRAVATPGRLRLTSDHEDARLLVRATIDPAELTPDAGIRVGFGDTEARLRVLPVDVTVPEGLRVGLVRGPDDTTERALADLGVDVTLLDRDSLMTEALERFTTLLLDIRVNYHRDDLAEMRDRVLQFCRAGGRVVVMYHKPGEWNVKDAQHSLAPFPLTVGNERVTEEDAPVTLLQPEHRLLRHPHAIGAADFAGWVQERGLNFPSRWDDAWTPLLEMKDSGEEKAHQGALLYTQYGRGDYVYCSLALYRQLRLGHAGAARLLVNLLAR